MNLAIRNGHLVDPKTGLDRPGDLFVSQGKIIAVGAEPPGFRAEKTIDAAGLIVAPGLIDLSARPAPLASDLAAAVAGGVTTLVSPPDMEPTLDEPERVQRLTRQANDLELARLLPLGALTRGLAGERLSEMNRLAAASCVAFSQGKSPLPDTRTLLSAFEYAATFGFPVWLQPQDECLSRDGVAHDGEVAARLGLIGIPVSAETVALSTLITLAADTGVRLHLCCVSSAAGMEMVKEARARGLPITCDASIHHLHFSERAIGFFNADARFNPPLRSERDRDAIRKGAAAGEAALSSDHTPQKQDDKQLPFGSARPGATGLELLLSLTLRWASEENLPLPKALAAVTSRAADILGREDLGHLGIGARADLCLFKADDAWTVAPDTLVSENKSTPFQGQTLLGRTRFTLVDGKVVFAAA
ncbi:MAG: dihydroorotase [Zoogloeaceae bacterium]|jgi:dihydroorotase|nr:dihydroorotase [Zoogloeaceae bacterium]